MKEMALKTDQSHIWRRSSMNKPPILSELRIVVLGKNVPETRRVGNFILGRDVFETEDPPPSLVRHSERASVLVEGRYITLIHTPHLLHPELTQEELTQRVKECVCLADPGPHVIVLVIQPDNFTEADRKRVGCIFRSLSEDTHKYTLVIRNMKTGTSSQQHEEDNISVAENVYSLSFHSWLGYDHSAFVKMVEIILENNRGRHLICDVYSDAPLASEHQVCTETAEDHGTTAIKSMTALMKYKERLPERLKLVLCGSDGALKSTISDLILGQKEQRAEPTLECVKREGEVCGHLLTLVEMPALYNTQLSEEQVMCETFRCISLCDPGVHAFLFIINNVHLTDEDKGEIKEIQKIFSSTVNNYSIFLFNSKESVELDNATKAVIEAGKGHLYFPHGTKPAELLKDVVQIVSCNRDTQRYYTTIMYSEVQMQTQLKYKAEIEKLKQTNDELRKENENQRQESIPNDLRLVLLGKTGVGKSATGNTILGKTHLFKEGIYDQSGTSMCQKETAEINGMQVAVIDTPGLFDTDTDNEEIKKEIVKCITMTAPGPHVFMILLKIGQKFTKEEKDTVKLLENTFGHSAMLYTMVLFTSGDTLQTTIDQYVANCTRDTQSLIQKCSNRYHVVNNKKPEDRVQVNALLNKINALVTSNRGSYYTNEMFHQTENALQEQQKRILKEREAEIEREKEEMKRKHEAEMEKMNRIMEEERKKQESERRRREKEFKEREEEIKRETTEWERLEREQYNKRREEDEKMMKEWMEKVYREKEENRKQWERQREEDQRLRDQEEEERSRREHEWEEKQRKDKEKFDQEKEEMIQKQRDNEKKLQQEYEQKKAEEEQKRAELEEQIRHAEESKKKELQKIQLYQKWEWETKMKEEEKRREDRENMWRQTLWNKEEHWTLEQQIKQQQYEQEKKIEMEKRTMEENERKLKEEQEKKRIEDEANEKIQQLQRDMKLQRETEVRQREEEYKKKLEEESRILQETFHKGEEERVRAHKEEEERKMAYMRALHKQEKKRLRMATEQEARQQAEREFCNKLDEKLKEAKAVGHRAGYIEGQEVGHKVGHEKGFIEGYESVEAQRTKLGKSIDAAVIHLLNTFNKGKKKN